MEASALQAPALGRLPLGLPLLRLRSDEQLLSLFRSGSDEAFRVLHDRYRQRLFAYVRQMLSAAPRQDAEDVMQDVFVRAYGALRADRREVNVRAWLYRVAHNRCIDHLRRPAPPAAEIFELSRKPLLDPIEEAARREDLARLVEDVGRLPEQQRSALLMREIDGMSYADVASALDVTVPAVKSLLVRARVGLVEAADARDADCADIRDDLLGAYDRGVKASARARRHMRTCETCCEYRAALRGVRRSFAALSPVAAGPMALTAKLLGLAGGGGGAAAGGSAAAGGGAAAATAGGVATVSACKVAAVVCTAAITAGGAVEVGRLADRERDGRAEKAAVARNAAPAAPAAAAGLPGGQAVTLRRAAAMPGPVVRHAPARPARAPAPPAAPAPRAEPGPGEAPAARTPVTAGDADKPLSAEENPSPGGAVAPEAEPDEAATPPAAAPKAADPPRAPGTVTQPAPAPDAGTSHAGGPTGTSAEPAAQPPPPAAPATQP